MFLLRQVVEDVSGDRRKRVLPLSLLIPGFLEAFSLVVAYSLSLPSDT